MFLNKDFAKILCTVLCTKINTFRTELNCKTQKNYTNFSTYACLCCYNYITIIKYKQYILMLRLYYYALRREHNILGKTFKEKHLDNNNLVFR